MDRTLARERAVFRRPWHNLRDLGGLGLGHGRQLRHGLLYRAGVCRPDTAATSEHPPSLIPHTIFDLRSSGERQTRPTPWREMGGSRYWCSDEADSSADLRRVLFAHGASAAEVRAAMIALYADLPFTQRGAYRAVVESLASGHVPLIFHCAAGKDRTGVLAALILAYLGASDAVILADYLLSNDAPDHLAALGPDAEDDAAAAHPTIPAELRAPLLTADPRYLEAMFTSLQQSCGGIAAYFEETLGMSSQMRAALETILVDSEPSSRWSGDVG